MERFSFRKTYLLLPILLFEACTQEMATSATELPVVSETTTVETEQFFTPPLELTSTLTPTSMPTEIPLLDITDKGRIYFVSQEDNTLYELDTNGMIVSSLLSLDAGQIFSSWSPDMHQLAINYQGENGWEIATLDSNGENFIQIDSHGLLYSLSPSWSPDGQRLAFSATGDTPSDIYIMNIGTNELQRITQDNNSENSVQWSPDGSRIAYDSVEYGTGPQNENIFLINADGTEPTPLTNGIDQENIFPDWSPDGQQIAFASSRNGNADIFVINIDGTGLRQLTDSPANESRPVWSPDGQYIAFQSEHDGKWGIYVMNSDGSGLLPISDQSMSAINPQWYP